MDIAVAEWVSLHVSRPNLRFLDSQMTGTMSATRANSVWGQDGRPASAQRLASTEEALKVVNVDVLEFPDAADWESWLAMWHGDRREAWLRIGKRHSGMALLTITDALDVALCYGWIDGQRRSLDDVSFLQRYSRRRPKSSWSRVNVAKVEALIAADRLRPAALAEVAAAKADGRWDAAYESQRTAEVPADLAAALADNAGAKSAFERLGRSARYLVILSLLKARSPGTRARTLERAVARLADEDTVDE